MREGNGRVFKVRLCISTPLVLFKCKYAVCIPTRGRVRPSVRSSTCAVEKPNDENCGCHRKHAAGDFVEASLNLRLHFPLTFRFRHEIQYASPTTQCSLRESTSGSDERQPSNSNHILSSFPFSVLLHNRHFKTFVLGLYFLRFAIFPINMCIK